MACDSEQPAKADDPRKSSLLGEFRRFGEMTAVRGIPRAVSAPNRILRIVWTLGVMSCAIVLGYQLVIVCIKYLQFQHKTVIEEDQHIAMFPDVTLCDTYGLSHTSSEELQWDDYMAAMNTKKASWSYRELKLLVPHLTRTAYDELWRYLTTPHAYFSSLPVTNRTSPRENLILECWGYGWDWRRITGMDCTRKPLLRTHWHSMYRRCHTIHIPENLKQSVRGLAIIAAVSDHDSDTINNFQTELFESKATGVRVAIQTRDHAPDMHRGETVSPGTESTLWVRQVIRQRMPNPWGRCSYSQTLGASACMEVCAQNQIIEECGCVSDSIAFTHEQLALTGFTVCGNQTSSDDGSFPTSPISSSDGSRNLLCSFGVNMTWAKCSQMCFRPCTEHQYDVSVSSPSNWPQSSYHAAFYGTYAKRAKNLTLANGSLAETISRHFLQLNVAFKHMHTEVLKDEADMTTETLFSDIGGLLSLWLGVTVMTLFELVDLFYRLGVRCWGNCRHKDESTSESGSS